MLKNLGQGLPIYVTNKTADGFIAQYDAPIGVTLLIMLLGMLNALVWGCIGLWKAVEVIF